MTVQVESAAADTTGFHALITDADTRGWYVADTENITYDGSNYISQWNDLSANANHLIQGNASYRPIWSSANSRVEFGGTDDYLYNVEAISQPYTVYLVVYQVNRTSLSMIYTADPGNGILQGSTDSSLRWYHGEWMSTDQAAIGEWGIVTAVANGTSSLIQWNQATASTGNAGTAAAAYICLGWSENAATFHVKELIVRAGVDSESERTLIYNYLTLINGL